MSGVSGGYGDPVCATRMEVRRLLPGVDALAPPCDFCAAALRGDLALRERRAARAAAEAAGVEARAARRGSRVVPPARINPVMYGVSPEDAARYRLARMVRGR